MEMDRLLLWLCSVVFAQRSDMFKKFKVGYLAQRKIQEDQVGDYCNECDERH